MPSSPARRSSRAPQSGAATVPESLLAKVRALPEVAAAGGTIAPIAVQRGQDLRPRRQGARLRRRAPVRARQRRVPAAVQPAASSRPASCPGTEAGRHRRRHGGRRELQGRRLGPGVHARSQAPLRGHRHRHLRRRRLARRRHDGDLGPADRADAAAQAGPLRRHLDRRQGGHVALRARPRRPAARSRQPGGQGLRAAGGRGRQGDQRHPQLRPLLPAGLRLHRAVRRRVRHLQHAVDHRRPAHAGVRDAADPRRLAQAGDALGRAGGPGDRAARLRGRALRRARPREVDEPRSAATSRRPGWCSRPGRSSSRSPSAP